MAGVADPRIGVVMATRNRRPRLLATLERLAALPEAPAVIVVDNASDDGSAGAVRRRFPAVEVIALPANEGASARNVGSRRAATPYVAFSDDDSWWEPGALGRAADSFDADARLGLLAAAVRVGDDRYLDPTSEVMAASPLDADLNLRPAGPRGVLGFVACGAVVRRGAFLAAGGFPAELGIGSEEEPVALRLAAAGWRLAYHPGVVAIHHPGAGDERVGRQRRMARNRLLGAWMTLPAGDALRATAVSAARPGEWAALGEAARLGPWAVASRRRVPAPLAAARRAVAGGAGGASVDKVVYYTG